MSISKKAWTFPARPYYYILYFQKLIESLTTVRQKEERDILGPRENLEGKSCLAGSFLVLMVPEGTYWGPGAAPSGEELPCRFLSVPHHGLGTSWRLLTSILAWKNLMDRGNWQAIFHGVIESQTQLSN